MLLFRLRFLWKISASKTGHFWNDLLDDQTLYPDKSIEVYENDEQKVLQWTFKDMYVEN